MAKTAKPWYRKDRDTWTVWVDGRQVPLAKGKANRDEAERAFHSLMAKRGLPAEPGTPEAEGHTVQWLCDRLLLHVRAERAPGTYDWYEARLGPLVVMHGSKAAASIRPHHVAEWLAAHPDWGPTTRANAITAVKRVWRWGKRQGYLDVDHLEDVEKPTRRVREAILSPDQFRLILASAKDRAWRCLLTALWETGCRPKEVATVRAKDVDLRAGTWTVINKTRHRGERTRTIYLTPRMVALSKTLMIHSPHGPLFTNQRGRPWTRNAMACRFARLRAKLGFGGEATAYAIRHVYATDALVNEVPIATVAELMGHKSTAMVSRVYSKLKQRGGYLAEAARKVRPGDGPEGKG